MGSRLTHSPSFAVVASLLVSSLTALPEPMAAQAQGASSPSAATGIAACYVPATGTMYRIGETGLASDCLHSSHVRMEWSSGGESANTPGSVVGRDASGGFTAGAVSLSSLAVSGLSSLGNGMVRLDDEGGILALGPTNFFNDSGSPLAVGGPGARMFWYPRIQAFRAGFAEEDEWDEDNLGDQSAAFGFATLASGDGSFSAGVMSEATGMGAMALGYQAIARGRASVSLGNFNHALGSSSVAAGDRTEASGDYSVALGSHTVAGGEGAVALGNFSQAPAQWAFAAGEAAEAQGSAAVALGYRTVASGDGATALNWQARASGQGALAAGILSDASAAWSTALGERTTASGEAGLAAGQSTTASGLAAVSLGAESTASGDASTTLGVWNTAGGNWSTAMGYNAAALHDGSFAYGDGSVTPSGGAVSTTTDNQFVVLAQHIWLGQDNSVTPNPVNFLDTSTGAYLTTGGAWTNSSDVARKHLFEDVDPAAILKRVSALPVREWSYKAEDDGVRHLGPTAQDFHAAFGLGGTDRAISTVDADGVALLAIQALERRTRELEADNAELRRRLEALEATLAARRHP